MRIRTIAWWVAALLGALPVCGGAATAERFVLAAGANDGGAERVRLRYAGTDAERFADLMVQMGGVDPSRRVLLTDPSRRDLERALGALGGQVAAARGPGVRTEVMLYYSGHADEDGLLMGGERLGYRDLRRLMDQVQADVCITVLDACASGAITRLKGGQRREAFLLDTASDTRGYAFLTSSSAEETAQESDRIQSSFFTYYLLSGMRGAADASGDGQVTLSEAYHFAFSETLARTVELKGGAQHPNYDMSLTGTGDVVMTDVRRTSAGLLLAGDLGGRVFVRNADRQVVAELLKPGDRAVELGLEPGRYQIYLERGHDLQSAAVEVADGQRRTLAAADFAPVPRELAVARGGPPWAVPAPPVWAGRWRVELHLGTVGPEPRPAEVGRTAAEDMLGGSFLGGRPGPWNALTGISVGYWVRDDFEVRLSYGNLSSDVPSGAAPAYVGDYGILREVRLYSILLGARQYLPVPRRWERVRPYLAVALGSYVGSESGRTVGTVAESWEERRGSPGGQLGAGADLRLTPRVLFGASAAYNRMAEFGRAIGGRHQYNGAEYRAGLSWVFR